MSAEIFAAVSDSGRAGNCLKGMEQFGDLSVGGIGAVESDVFPDFLKIEKRV